MVTHWHSMQMTCTIELYCCVVHSYECNIVNKCGTSMCVRAYESIHHCQWCQCNSKIKKNQKKKKHRNNTPSNRLRHSECIQIVRKLATKLNNFHFHSDAFCRWKKLYKLYHWSEKLWSHIPFNLHYHEKVSLRRLHMKMMVRQLHTPFDWISTVSRYLTVHCERVFLCVLFFLCYTHFVTFNESREKNGQLNSSYIQIIQKKKKSAYSSS